MIKLEREGDSVNFWGFKYLIPLRTLKTAGHLPEVLPRSRTPPCSFNTPVSVREARI